MFVGKKKEYISYVRLFNHIEVTLPKIHINVCTCQPDVKLLERRD